MIEIGQLIAGPFAGKTLGEFGAEVIKIEPPGAGDPLRNWLVDCETLADAVAATRRLDFDTGVFEIRPLGWFDPGVIPARIPAPAPPAEK